MVSEQYSLYVGYNQNLMFNLSSLFNINLQDKYEAGRSFVFVRGVDHCYAAGSSSCNRCWFLAEYDWQPSPRLATVCVLQICCFYSLGNYTQENRAKHHRTCLALPAFKILIVCT